MSLAESENLKFKMRIVSAPSVSPAKPHENSDSSMSNTGSNDMVIYIDNNSLVENSGHPSLGKLLDKLNVNIELDSTKKQLELEEKRIQIAMLEEEKAYKAELNKHTLLQKSFDLKKKTSELDYTNKLRDLLIEAINNGDFHKCSYLNICLNNHNETSNIFDINNKNSLANLTTSNYLNAMQFNNTRNLGFGPGSVIGGAVGSSNGGEDNEINQYNNMDNFSDHASYIDEGTNMIHNNHNNIINNNSNNNNNGLNSNIIDVGTNNLLDSANQFNFLDESEHDNSYEHKVDLAKQFDVQQINALNSLGLTKQLTQKNTYLLGNRNIRHMICSSHKLEEYSNSAALKILFKGKCTDNDMCRRKEVHTHYLIDTTDCRRHISLYFQSSKYGLKFFKTYQIKSQGELEKIIRTFKMKHVC